MQNSKRKILSICAECEFMYYFEELDYFCCGSPNAAVNEYVHGLSLCSICNDDGCCPMFRQRPPCECPDCQAKRNNQIPEEEINELCKANGIN